MSTVNAMLSAQDVKVEDIRVPCWLSIKYDGVRAMARGGQAMSRSGLPLPNKHVQAEFAHWTAQLEHLDGELIVGDIYNPDCYNVTQSAIMSQEGAPDFKYYVFDYIKEPNLTFEERQNQLSAMFVDCNLPDWVVRVYQHKVHSTEEIKAIYSGFVSTGLEGVITRAPEKPYKFGRSSPKEQGMVKVKPRDDGEFRVIGIGEAETNTNAATVGGRGETKRSSHKAGKVAKGTLGWFLCVELATGLQFKLGTFKGLKAKDKQYIFDHQDEFMGKIGTFTHCPIGRKDLPRTPSFKGWRDPIDMI